MMRTFKLNTAESDIIEMSLISRLFDIESSMDRCPDNAYHIEYLTPEYYQALGVLTKHLNFQVRMIQPRVFVGTV